MFFQLSINLCCLFRVLRLIYVNFVVAYRCFFIVYFSVLCSAICFVDSCMCFSNKRLFKRSLLLIAVEYVKY